MQQILKRYGTLALVAIVIVGAIVILESRKADTGGGTVADADIAIMDENERVAAKEGQFERAKEISTPDAFINTDEISIGELVGEKVVLVDFWTYSCINCQRTLPHLNAWHEKYADDGLVIIGVHTPEFEFEQKVENVQRAVEKYGVKYPVVVDNDFSTWRSYRNRYWPRKYLIGVDGFIRYDHIGEGSYEETEKKIVELLNEKNQVLGIGETVQMSGETVATEGVDFEKVATPEIYFGSARVEYLANLPQQQCLSSVCTYDAPESVALNSYGLGGDWQTTSDYIELAGGEGSITLHFSARSVNIVAGAADGAQLEILLDGAPITAEDAGAAVEGGSVSVSSEDLYNLVELDEYGEHVLEIRVKGEGLQAFTFTFG